jgi:ribonuclease HI
MADKPPVADIDAIVAAIQQLSPEQRRQLQRRLRVSGLFLPEAAITDQDRLRAAPALGVRARQYRNSAHSVSVTPAHAVEQTPRAGYPAADEMLPGAAPSKTGATPYRSPISGKVVVGGPNAAVAEPAPHAMLPLPGQAPEQPIQIVFDGGSKGNPGKGYGSYELRWPGLQPQVVRLQFGNNVTNNEAEYDTLIAALEAVLKRLDDSGADPATAQVEVRGDSLLVVNQVLGKWQVKTERMGNRCERVRQLLARFGHWHLSHHDRAHSVERLGH